MVFLGFFGRSDSGSIDDTQIDAEAFGEFERDRVGVGFGAWAADDDLHAVADGVDETAVAGG
jgi:hypothetical protein